jgi:hypothetical protein
MFSFRASFWNTDVYINGQEKYAANEILTAYLNEADELLRIPWIGDLKRLRHDLMIEADMEYYRVENYNSNVWEAVKILDSLNEAIDRMPPYDRIYVRGHYMLTDLLNEYKELFNRAFVMDEEDEELSRLTQFEPDVSDREWPDPDLPESAEDFNAELAAFFDSYLGLLAACREVKKVYAPFVTGILHRESAFPDSHVLAKMFRDFEERE